MEVGGVGGGREAKKKKSVNFLDHTSENGAGK